MKSPWGVAVFVGSVALIFGAAAVTWHFVEAKAKQRKIVEHAKAYRVRAEHGDAIAQVKLGSSFYYGKGVPQDYAEAIVWYRKAADQGYARAQYALGYSYQEGKEVPRDYTAAVTWYRKAADQGYAEAQSALG